MGPTGITDKAVLQAHDLLDHAEAEERQMHAGGGSSAKGKKSQIINLEGCNPSANGGGGGAGGQNSKKKDALHKNM
ncbi:hypothetical protein BD289DRAFT_280401 [Coniella lustricola]|uniref:Uncharacterized protein n=1 Tax=Coniella lustricola TaxID=2025994 RepID=A0A2T3A674_9PEZI|nr:hypothetical protein BD289DRAFT_280401 [Coniella lustricola]